MNTKLLESLADIAYNAGVNRYYSGDSRADMHNFIHWAKEFEAINKDTDWDEENYMLAIEDFASAKLCELINTSGRGV
jgi:hypothetical protein